MEPNELLEPFARMLADVATPSAVRAIEGGGGSGAMWDAIAASGFLEALVVEDYGGAGLSLAEIEPLVEVIGARAVPLPVSETMAARALLAEAGIERPGGPIAFASALGREIVVPCGLVADHILIDRGEVLVLANAWDLSPQPTGVEGALAARVVLTREPHGVELARPSDGLRPLAAVLRSALIAGAAMRLLETTTAYANERVQFGKPIGRQQALQQNLAVMAEDAVAARFAAQLGCASGLPPSLAAAATAKSVTSTASARIAATAHAVHGAIGISEEFDLQLLTRRLHEWRLADGSEGYWNRALGEVRLAAKAGSVDWVRAEVFA